MALRLTVGGHFNETGQNEGQKGKKYPTEFRRDVPRLHLSSSSGVQRTVINYLLTCVQRIANLRVLLLTGGLGLIFLLWT